MSEIVGALFGGGIALGGIFVGYCMAELIRNRRRAPEPMAMDEGIDGFDYSPTGIRALRDEVIAMREARMTEWPEGIQDSVTLTHVIALLAEMARRAEIQG